MSGHVPGPMTSHVGTSYLPPSSVPVATGVVSHASSRVPPIYDDHEMDPWSVKEGHIHCFNAFDRLRAQREQGRYCDLTLSIGGRKFQTHRCVMASVSSWFDSKLKMHKTMKEEIEIDCQNLEVFYAVLTYCYTGQITIQRNNVDEILLLSDKYVISKLKGYCVEYLNRCINMDMVFVVLDLGVRINSSDLINQSLAFIQRHFEHLCNRHEMISLNFTILSLILNEGLWCVSQDTLLIFISHWVDFNIPDREGHLLGLLQIIHWNNLTVPFIAEHIERTPLYQKSQEALFSILSFLVDRQGIYLGQKLHDLYQSLQERFLPDQELDELNDSNSFLSLAINNVVKDLEHSEVDTDWFLQSEPPPTEVYRSVEPGPSSGGTNSLSKIERYKDAFDLEIVEQLINEQRMSDERGKYRDPASSIKRYDPKFRALNEVFRQGEIDSDSGDLPTPTSCPSHLVGPQSEVSLTTTSSSSRIELRHPQTSMDMDPEDRHYMKTSSPTHSCLRADVVTLHSPSSIGAAPNTQSQAHASMHQGGKFMKYEETKLCPDLGFESGKSIETWDATSMVLVSQGQPTACISSHKLGVRGEGVTSPTGTGKLLSLPQATPCSESPSESLIDHGPKPSEYCRDSDLEMIPETPLASNPTSPLSEDQVHIPVSNPNPSPPPPPPPHAPALSESAIKDTELISFGASQVVLSPMSKKRLVLKHQQMSKAPTSPSHRPSHHKHHVTKKAKLLAEHRKNPVEDEPANVPTPSSHMMQCEHCPYKTSVRQRMTNHRKQHAEDIVLDCPLCSFQVKWKKELNSHIQAQHFPGPPYACDFKGCSYKKNNLCVFLEHRKIHGTNKGYKCDRDNCHFSTKTKNRLDIHKKCHEGSFPCPTCDKVFKSITALSGHKQVHTNERPFVCDQCPFSAKFKSNLNIHKKIHDGNIFRCDFANCSYFTPKLSYLKNHRRTHSGEKIFKCPECERGFVEKSQMTRHQLIHSDTMPFACSKCDFKTKRKDKLKNHLLRIHGVSGLPNEKSANIMLKYVALKDIKGAGDQ
eukprot:snap_masked-scaffold168_size293125-processed-gene-0.4 protein:Tk04451 transcript:snap_masked-scaffold168_size293125-processed-gene-0.4-mRNA-1 annotation:"hypothetical protein L798_10126"